MILRKWFGHQCHPITRNSHSILTILLIFQVFSTVDAKYVSVAYFKPWAQFCIIRHYSPGYAELTIGGKGIGYKNILVLFDSGSSYTYLNSQAYQAFISSVSSKLLLNVCWHYSTGRIPEKSWYESLRISYNIFILWHFELPPHIFFVECFEIFALQKLFESIWLSGEKKKNWDIIFLKIPLVVDPIKRHDAWKGTIKVAWRE